MRRDFSPTAELEAISASIRSEGELSTDNRLRLNDLLLKLFASLELELEEKRQSQAKD